MADSSPGRRRPRPVADAPVIDGAELAKAWLVELVAVTPLERAAGLAPPRFAEDAPRLCSAVVAALSSEAAFDELEPGGTLAPVAAGSADLAAARDALDALVGLEALRTVTWEAIVAALDRPRPATVADLGDRLGAIMSALAAASFAPPSDPGTLRPGDRGPLAAILRSRWAPDAPEPATAAPPPPPEPQRAAPAPPAAEPDRWAQPPEPPPAEPDRWAYGPAALDERDLRSPLREVPAEADFARRPSRAPAIEDAADYMARRAAPWSVAIERRLGRHREDGLPFAVLCVELVDADRLVASDRSGDVAAALEAAETAMCAQLRPADALVRERPGRYWLTTPDTDPEEAEVVAHRIVAAVAAAPGHHGTPLQAAVGIASCPADGLDSGELEDHAEQGLYAARAAGVRVGGPPAV